jgi:hypothetical protein
MKHTVAIFLSLLSPNAFWPSIISTKCEVNNGGTINWKKART